MKRRKAAGQRPQGEDSAAQRKKRKRKQRLPKGFDPENPGPMPDPERWLPKWQRSDFKRRRGQRRRDKVDFCHCCMHLVRIACKQGSLTTA